MPHAVLIADNDRAVNGLLCELIGQQGHRVVSAYDGRQAQAHLQQGAVALLVCDLDMPALDGLGVLEWLGNQRSPPPSLVVSGFLDAGIERRLREMPFVRGIYQKPFDLLAFGDKVNDLLAGQTPAAEVH